MKDGTLPVSPLPPVGSRGVGVSVGNALFARFRSPISHRIPSDDLTRPNEPTGKWAQYAQDVGFLV